MQDIAAAFEQLPDLVDADEDLVRRGRFFSAAVLVGIGDVPFHVTIEHGRIAEIERGPKLLRSHDFAIRGTDEAWRRFWEPVPAAGWHDLFALTKRGAATVEGNLQPLMANLQYVKDLLAAPRRLAGGG